MDGREMVDVLTLDLEARICRQKILTAGAVGRDAMVRAARGRWLRTCLVMKGQVVSQAKKAYGLTVVQEAH
jgi:hypothetical protein